MLQNHLSLNSKPICIFFFRPCGFRQSATTPAFAHLFGSAKRRLCKKRKISWKIGLFCSCHGLFKVRIKRALLSLLRTLYAQLVWLCGCFHGWRLASLHFPVFLQFSDVNCGLWQPCQPQNAIQWLSGLDHWQSLSHSSNHWNFCSRAFFLHALHCLRNYGSDL